jgi:hypothetical protein
MPMCITRCSKSCSEGRTACPITTHGTRGTLNLAILWLAHLVLGKSSQKQDYFDSNICGAPQSLHPNAEILRTKRPRPSISFSVHHLPYLCLVKSQRRPIPCINRMLHYLHEVKHRTQKTLSLGKFVVASGWERQTAKRLLSGHVIRSNNNPVDSFSALMRVSKLSHDIRSAVKKSRLLSMLSFRRIWLHLRYWAF